MTEKKPLAEDARAADVAKHEPVKRIVTSGWVNEEGILEVDQPGDLPPGEVRVIIEPITEEEIAAEDARWDESFARSQDVLRRMADEALRDYEAGLIDELDPDKL